MPSRIDESKCDEIEKGVESIRQQQVEVNEKVVCLSKRVDDIFSASESQQIATSAAF